MKLNAFLVVPALLGALLLTACGEKAEETAAPAEAPAAAAAPAAEAAPAAPVVESAGGYEPTAEERVPGITIDPAAPAAEAAPAAPAEVAPVEAAPAEAK